jgi:hypothetical protein
MSSRALFTDGSSLRSIPHLSLKLSDYQALVQLSLRMYQVTATYFYSAAPNASVKDVWKALKIEGGLDTLLDAATS